MTELCLRGNRDYLQGTTIFDYIVDLLAKENPQPVKIDYRMNRMTNKKLLLRKKDANDSTEERIVGAFRCEAGEFDIVETDEEVRERCAYDEDTLMNICVFDKAEIFIPKEKSLNYTPIEKIISGNKFLLKREFSERKITYIFARLILDCIPFGDISISFSRIISGRYFESKIFDEGRAVGDIYFGFRE
ncbi:MAG: hypothetical protein P8013_05900 [Candidatus Sulfobium sp.]|jgi:hypothetical protein